MIIDNSIRKRWGLVPNSVTSQEEKELMAEPDFSSSGYSKLEFGNRFRVSAQEWLPTWRTIE